MSTSAASFIGCLLRPVSANGDSIYDRIGLAFPYRVAVH
jgi:hypothetical protein